MVSSKSGRVVSRGYAARDPGSGLAPFSFERRVVGPNDILIDILYCGICHSDIHKVRSEWGRSNYPIVPGHEIIGKVAGVGSSVRKFKVGDKVGVGCMVDSCRKCEACRNDAEYDCADGGTTWTYDSEEKKIGGRTYGGYSNNIVVDQDFVLRISPNVDLAGTAPLMCAGTTTYTPLTYWKAGPGKKIGVLGLGGLGHIAVKLAHSMGANVTVLTNSEKKIKDAKRLGADDVVLIGNEKEMKKHSASLDLIIDTASSKHDVGKFLELLKRNGKIVLVGLPSEALEIEPFSLVNGHRVLAGSGLGGIKGTQEMLDYCAEHGIVSDVEIIPIQKANEAYERIMKGDVRYRFVIDISSLK